MNRMDTMTVRWVLIWLPMAAVFLGADYLIRRELRRRREDKEWAAGVVRDMTRRGASPFLTEAQEAAFKAIVAHYNDVPLDEILDSEGED